MAVGPIVGQFLHVFRRLLTRSDNSYFSHSDCIFVLVVHVSNPRLVKEKRSDKDAINAKHARDRAVGEKVKIQKRLDDILDGQTTINSQTFLEQIELEKDEGDLDKPYELANSYIANHREALASATYLQAESALTHYKEDGEAALTQAEVYISSGLALAPTNLPLQNLSREINHIRSGKPADVWQLHEIDPSLSIEDLVKQSETFRQKEQFRIALQIAEHARQKARNENGITTQSHSQTLNEIGLILTDLREFGRAERVLKQAIEINKATVGESAFVYAIGLNNLAGVYRRTGRTNEAERLFKKANEIGKATVGKNSQFYGIGLQNHAALYDDTGRNSDAEHLYKQSIEILKTTLGPDNAVTISVKANLASLQSSH